MQEVLAYRESIATQNTEFLQFSSKRSGDVGHFCYRRFAKKSHRESIAIQNTKNRQGEGWERARESRKERQANVLRDNVFVCERMRLLTSVCCPSDCSSTWDLVRNRIQKHRGTIVQQHNLKFAAGHWYLGKEGSKKKKKKRASTQEHAGFASWMTLVHVLVTICFSLPSCYQCLIWKYLVICFCFVCNGWWS